MMQALTRLKIHLCVKFSSASLLCFFLTHQHLETCKREREREEEQGKTTGEKEREGREREKGKRREREGREEEIDF